MALTRIAKNNNSHTVCTFLRKQAQMMITAKEIMKQAKKLDTLCK